MKKYLQNKLEKLTKEELASAFPSLKLNAADKKDDIIESILASEPTDKEMSAFIDSIATKPEPVPEPKEDVKIGKYIVVHQIKENGKRFKVGSEYDGESAEKFLKGGQIRVR